MSNQRPVFFVAETYDPGGYESAPSHPVSYFTSETIANGFAQAFDPPLRVSACLVDDDDDVQRGANFIKFWIVTLERKSTFTDEWNPVLAQRAEAEDLNVVNDGPASLQTRHFVRVWASDEEAAKQAALDLFTTL